MKHLISLKEQSKQDLLEILDLAKKIKNKKEQGQSTNYLVGKTLIMLFEKTSTRTRLSFEAGMSELGGHAIFLDSRTTQFSMADAQDEIKAVMGYGDLLMYRAKSSVSVKNSASLNIIPVIDACSEKYHPAQALSDILSMSEISGGVENVKKITWLGVENNVSNTLALACAKLGIKVCIIAPEVDNSSIDEELNQEINNSGLVSRTLDLEEGLKDTNYIHTDTWMNMEFFDEGKIKPEFQELYDKKIKTFMPYQLSAELVNKYAPQAKIMHCMPCHVGYEITREAIDHPNSIIFESAKNRLHIQKAMMMWLLGKEVV